MMRAPFQRQLGMNASTDQESGYVYSATPGGTPIKSWTKGVPVEERAWNQVQNVARLPFVHGMSP